MPTFSNSNSMAFSSQAPENSKLSKDLDPKVLEAANADTDASKAMLAQILEVKMGHVELMAKSMTKKGNTRDVYEAEREIIKQRQKLANEIVKA